MISRKSLTWILTIVALTTTAFFAGLQWPRTAPALVITEQPPQADLSLEVQGGQLTGQAPQEGSLMADTEAFAPGESFKINLDQAFPLHFWTSKWALTLSIKNANELSAKKEAAQEELYVPKATTNTPDKQHNFVASRSGTKYHPITNCSYADRIKPQNKIFFTTEQEAQSAGYTRSSCFK